MNAGKEVGALQAFTFVFYFAFKQLALPPVSRVAAHLYEGELSVLDRMKGGKVRI
jgi:hypothetical protein